LTVNGAAVSIPGLPLIFEQCRERGIADDETGASDLLETVKIYHSVPPEQEAEYRDALVAAYRRFGADAGPAH
jgi:hypothetical protein